MKIRLCTLLLLALAIAAPAAYAGNKHHHVKHARHHTNHNHHAYHMDSSVLDVNSRVALVYDEQTQLPLYTKNTDVVVPIASITKLMTAMVVLDANLPMDEMITVGDSDLHLIRSRSRLKVGTVFTRSELLNLALMSSENRAALALAKSYPGGEDAFVAAMNVKSSLLGMSSTRFFDPTGLDSDNVSTAQDLVKMVDAAQHYELIHQYTTTAGRIMDNVSGRSLKYHNTNPLVSNSSWVIGVSKTGFINKAGRCLVMQAVINNRPVIIVLLHSNGKRTRFADATRVKSWIERYRYPTPMIMQPSPDLYSTAPPVFQSFVPALSDANSCKVEHNYPTLSENTR
jgi:D-alanyl-D-alanine endopeptidase (penicillin-binding protein 7)